MPFSHSVGSDKDLADTSSNFSVSKLDIETKISNNHSESKNNIIIMKYTKLFEGKKCMNPDSNELLQKCYLNIIFILTNITI